MTCSLQLMGLVGGEAPIAPSRGLSKSTNIPSNSPVAKWRGTLKAKLQAAILVAAGPLAQK